MMIRKHIESTRNAFTLLECIVYMSAFALVLGLALMAFYRCFDHMQASRRNSDDISRALHAGEVWRADVRAAIDAIRFNDNEQTVRIPCANREVFYRFGEAQVWRKASVDAPWAVFLPQVQGSQMQADVRKHVTAWRWDVELKTKSQKVKIRPQFAFLAVPATKPNP